LPLEIPKPKGSFVRKGFVCQIRERRDSEVLTSHQAKYVNIIPWKNILYTHPVSFGLKPFSLLRKVLWERAPWT